MHPGIYSKSLQSSLRKSYFIRAIVAILLMPGLGLWTSPLQANPSGGVVIHGDVNFSGGAGNLQINQSSQKAIINWADFSIDAGELAQFNQGGISAAVLNRVTGGNPTVIHGALKANGSVFVINPNGILVGASGVIDVHGLALSTLDVSNGEFLGGGDIVFKGTGEGITNMGKINAIGGDVFLIGKTVSNTGTISAPEGLIGMAAGEEILLKANADVNGERIFVRAAGSGVSGTGILNDGTIEGAAVELKAHGNMYALAINNKGSIRATGASTSGGKVFLNGVGGSLKNSGSIRVSGPAGGGSGRVLIEAAYARVDGTLSASNADGSGGNIRISSTNITELTGDLDVVGSGANGGSIIVEGDVVTVGANSNIDASGVTGGGSVKIGGGFQGRDDSILNASAVAVERGAMIVSDATISGNAGSVIIWADYSTRFEGAVSAQAKGTIGNGGFVEVSGKDVLIFDGMVSTLSAGGRNGTLLLDPTDLTISNSGASANNVNIANLIAALGAGNVVVSTNAAGTTQDGDLRITANMAYTSVNALTLLGYGDVEFTGGVQNEGSGAINVVAGWDGSTGFTPASPGGSESGTVAMTDFFNDSTSYGNAKTGGGNGSVILSSASRRVNVGSRHGETNVAGYDLDFVLGVGGMSLGIRDINSNTGANAATGAIRVEVLNNITLKNSDVGRAEYEMIQIGHGGRGDDTGPGPGDLSGAITVVAGVDGKGQGNITFRNEGVTGVGGERERLALQIGHGGFRIHGNHSGKIVVDTRAGTVGNIDFKAGDGKRNYAMIGHGGYEIGASANGLSTSPLSMSGEIEVLAGGDIAFEGGSARGAAPSMSWRESEGAFAKIGHGGYNSDGNHSDNITVNSGGSISFKSGDQRYTFAQIGHGGHASDGNHSGVIDVDAVGSITFDARGLGGEPDTNNRSSAFAMLGHGGNYARGDHSGAIMVDTQNGDISFYSGNNSPIGNITSEGSQAMLGHGGLDAKRTGTTLGNTGAITVNSGGALSFIAGNGRINYVQLGHGGYDNDGSHDSDITVTAVNDITFSAGLGFAARDRLSSAQLGNGGFGANGVQTGDISVTSSAGAINFKSGDKADNIASLGNGGRSGRSGSATEGHSGDITVSAGTGITFTAGTMSDRTTANGFQDLAPYSSLPGDADTTNGDEGIYADGRIYTQLGHGGWDADASDGNNRYVGVGHSGSIAVTTATGDITFNAGSVANGSAGADQGAYHYALLGHGGNSVAGDHSGAITVEATTGNVNFNGGVQTIDFSVNNTDGTVNPSNDVYNYAQLGHGGTSAVGFLSASNISVTAGDGVNFTAGTGRRSHVLLGLGGYGYRGSHVAEIEVAAGVGGVNFLAGTGAAIARDTFAQLGNGGLETEFVNNAGAGSVGHSGNITVTTTNGGDVQLKSGTASGNYTQLGNGGRSDQADHGGNITVDADGDITLTAGDLSSAYSQIGNGGIDAKGNHTGEITVVSGGHLKMAAGGGTEGWASSGAYAQIGHGGLEADGNHSGNIKVRAQDELIMSGGASYRNYSQIGHGGRLASGSKSGIVSVVANIAGDAGTPNSQLIGGGSFNEASVQIGHGGVGGDSGPVGGGFQSGNIELVIANGDLDLIGGDFSNSYVTIGHGDVNTPPGNSVDLGGTSEGNISLIVGGELSIDYDNPGDPVIGHRGGEATRVGPRSLLLDVGHLDNNIAGTDSLFTVNGTVINSFFRPYLNNNLNDTDLGHVTFSTGTADILWESDFDYASTNDLSLLSRGDIFFTRRIKNREDIDGGSLNVVAGWNGVGGGVGSGYNFDFNELESVVRNGGTTQSGFDVVSLKAHAAANGQNSSQFGVDSGSGGDVVLGKNEDGVNLSRNVYIGSASGGTNVFGRDVILAAGADTPSATWRAAAQIGVQDRTVNPNYDINDALAPGKGEFIDLTGDISVNTTRNILMDGAITPGAQPTDDPDPSRGGAFGASVAQIGHGGLDQDLSDHAVIRGMIAVDVGGGITANGGNTEDTFVLIGHGGRSNNNTTISDPSNYRPLGHLGGEISVRARTGDITFTAGEGIKAFAQIGNGGYTVRPGNQDATINTDVTVIADTGAIKFQAGLATQDGGNQSHAMIGNGGYESDMFTAGQGWQGDIKVTAGGLIDFRGGTGEANYAQLGHGGWSSASGVSLGGGAGLNGTGHIGDIEVQAGTGINFIAGTASAAEPAGTDVGNYAMLGHGGRDAGVNANGAGSNPTLGHRGDISVLTTTGNINFYGGDNDIALGTLASAGAGTGRFLFSQIGHGGYGARGAHQGAIKVGATAGSINFRAGNANDNDSDVYHFAQLGHTKVNNGNDYDLSSFNANLTGTNGLSLGLTSGIEVNAGNAITFTASTQRRSQAQLGLGGFAARGDHSGDIRVTAGSGGITFRGGQGETAGSDGIESYAQLGNGGFDSDAVNGVVGDGNSGSITVTTTGGGDINFLGGTANDNYAQLGHGGRAVSGTHHGDISVTSTGAINFIGSNDASALGSTRAYAQMGHGGNGATGSSYGKIAAITNGGGDINFQAGLSNDGYVQLGHGGRGASGDQGDDGTRDGAISAITVNSSGGIAFGGGTGATWGAEENYAQIGHGGFQARGDHVGDIDVDAVGDIVFRSGTSYRDYVQIGHGGWDADQASANPTAAKADRQGNLGNIEVSTANGNVSFSANGLREGYGQIGHGGHITSGDQSGTITVEADKDGSNFGLGGNITFDASGSLGEGSQFMMIGHGGLNSSGGNTGAITVHAGDDIAFTGGNSDAFGQIGHGGRNDHRVNLDSDGPDNIAGNADDSTTYENGNDQYFSGTQKGNIMVFAGVDGAGLLTNAGADIDLLGGSVGGADRSGVQIGHGGFRVAAEHGGANGNGHNGSITVLSSGAIAMTAGRGNQAPTQIGHGGYEAFGDHFGDIEVEGRNGITVTASPNSGRGDQSYAQIGHGGHEADFNSARMTSNEGLISDPGVAATGTGTWYNTNISVVDPTGTYGRIDVRAGVDFSGTTTNALADLIVNGGVDADGYAQVGHGGRGNNGNHGDDGTAAGTATNVEAGRSILFTGGSTNGRTSVQLGNGGDEAIGSHKGNITANARGGDLIFQAGSIDRSFALLGHGGLFQNNSGDMLGDIDVDAGGDIKFASGGGSQNWKFAQLGHGGHRVDGTKQGTIDVTAGGSITLDSTGATGSDGFTMIGHGGYNSDGAIGLAGTYANIKVDAGGAVILKGGTTDRSAAIIGHAGVQSNGNSFGNIEVGVGGDVQILSGTGLAAFAKIGNGGYVSVGNHSGDIYVHAATGVTLDSGSGGQLGFTQIGHGGYNSGGAHTGFVTVTNSTSGAISLEGGTGVNDKTSQIGHGGINNGNNALSGSISVVNLGGEVTVAAGDGSWRGAIIGHGDAQEAQTSGARTGGLNVYAAGNITMTDGAGNSGAYISHQTNSGIGQVSYAGSGVQAVGDSGYSLVANGTLTFGADQVAGAGNAIAFNDALLSAINQGDVSIASSGDLDVTPAGATPATLYYNSANSYTFASGGNLNMGFGLQNAGAGNINLFAGYDVANNPFAPPAIGSATLILGSACLPDFRPLPIPLPANCDVYGQNNGAITIGSAGQTNGVYLGSRQGDTNAFGYGVTLTGSNSTGNAGTQLGYRSDGSGDISGAVNIGVKMSGLTMTSGSPAGAYTQIGHGGFNGGAANTTADATVTISFCERGDLNLTGGGSNAYALIGHGINSLTGNMDGAIQVGTALKRAGAVTIQGGAGGNSFAQVGHGAVGSTGTRNGLVSLYATDGVSLTAGTGGDAFIGHGGTDSVGSLTGAIVVDSSGGDISVTANGFDSAATIGHSGKRSRGNRVGQIDVTAGGGSVNVSGGVGQTAVGAIGHGGSWDSGAVGETYSGDINVTAATDVKLRGGTVTQNSLAMIGHGGAQNAASRSGAITVTADSDGSGAGNLDIEGGAFTNTLAKIGHGGIGRGVNGGTNSGSIEVSGFDILLKGGIGSGAYAQIGHGAINASEAQGLGGDEIHVSGDSLVMTSGGGANAYAQIGMGGLNVTGALNGDICVHVATTATLDGSAGAGNSSYVQIGHGGVGSATGAKTGNIVVTTGTTGSGGVTLTGGDNLNEYAQIGHGGINSGGAMTGNLNVIADNGGNLSLTGGANSTSNYAMFGHGDGQGTTSTGTREGGIHLFAGGTLTATDGSAGETTNIWHQSNGGLSAADYLGGDGFQIIPDLANVAAGAKDAGEAAVLASENFGAGSVNYIDSSDADIVFAGNMGGDLLVNSSDDFFFVTGGKITFERSYQNFGTGNVTIVAGWNGAGTRPPAFVEYTEVSPGVFNYCSPLLREGGVTIDFNDCETFGADALGNGEGTITLGNAGQDNAVIVGTRLGRNVAAAYGMTMNAGDTAEAFTQFGYHNGSVGAGDMTGDIDLYLKAGGLTLNGGSAADTYVQIGHGGTGAITGTINAAINISFCEPGDIIFNNSLVATAGTGSHAYTQIGHGITDSIQTSNGNITISNFKNITMNSGSGDTAFSMIGLGGDNSDGNKLGNVTLTGATDVAKRGSIALNAGGDRAFAQIGVGGRAVNNFKFGQIDITDVENLNLSGGAGVNSYAHVGNGGGEGANGDLQGNINIDIGGNLTMAAGSLGNAYVQVGHGGHTQSNGAMRENEDNDITITTGGYVSLNGSATGSASNNNAAQAYAQIGHGGRGSQGSTSSNVNDLDRLERYGDIKLDINGTDLMGNALSITGGESNEAYAQVGHGGRAAFSYYKGDITIDAEGSIGLTAGNRSRGYSMIGHGGDDSEKVAGTIGAGGFGDLEGNEGAIAITTTNGGGLTMAGSADSTGNVDSNVTIGHGGHSTFGNHSGAITLSIDGAIDMDGGAQARSYVQIGHGGQDADGTHTGVLSVTSGGAITGTSGTGGASYVQIGHGGVGASGFDNGSGTEVVSTSSVTVTAENNIEFDRNIGNSSDSYAMIGHGGNGANGEKSGVISVTSINGSILFGTDMDRTGRSAVQIGHGGRSSNGDTNGNILVEALNGDIKFHGTLANGNDNHREGYAQIGHGGRENTGNHGLVADLIDVDSGGVIEFLAGGSNVTGSGAQGREAYAQIGNGGFFSNGNHAGNIDVDAGGDITFDTRGSSGDSSYVHLGHGGRNSNGTFNGNINVNQNVAGGQITFAAGRSASYAMLGHGGRNDAGTILDLNGPDNILGGAGAADDDTRSLNSDTYAPGTITGDIKVGATGDISFTGGFEAGGTGFAQIGHGGYQQAAAAGEGHSGTIDVISSAGAINFAAGSRNIQFVMIGHGGNESFGNHFGAITVRAATGIAFAADGSAVGGDIRSFAQIGHGGYDSDFEVARSTADVGVVNGAGGFNPAIPQGAPGTNSGSIDISTTGVGADIVLSGSQGNSNTGRGGYAQFGHGGVSTEGNREGTIAVTSGGAVLLNRGTTNDAYVQIGHGGRSAHGVISNSAITVTSANGGKVALQGSGLPATTGSASRAYAQIGHGGHNANVQADSAITVTGAGGVDVIAGGFQEGYAMIGNGGDSSDAIGTGFDGDVTVNATAGDIQILSSPLAADPLVLAPGNRSWAKIGHGGYVSSTNADYSGNIRAIASAGSVIATAAANGNNNYVQIGHGGIANNAVTGHTGTITVQAANEITFAGGGDNGVAGTDDRRFAILGHGGGNSDGSHNGAITVNAGTDGSGSLRFAAGALIGSGEGPFAQLGHGGQNNEGDLGGTIIATAGDDIVLTGGDATDGGHAQIGHGGRNSKGDKSGSITVTATNGFIDLLAGTENFSFAQIGHGGHESDFTGALGGTSATDTINVTAGTNIRLLGTQVDNDGVAVNAAAQAYAQIGHGGHDADGSHQANVTVNALGGTLTVEAGKSNQAYAQIGHGGLYNGAATKGNQSGTIDVDALNAITIQGGDRERAYAQIGHGGFDHDGIHSGTITVDSWAGNVSVLGGSVVNAFAQIGHGGGFAAGEKDGNITVNAASGVTVAGQSANGAYGQIGHGGESSSGIIGASEGNISVTSATGNIDLAGNQEGVGSAHSQIGHGGLNGGVANDSAAGTITVNAIGGSVLLTGANGGSEDSFVQIGHGGQGSTYDVFNQLIDVDARGGAITLNGSFAQNSVMIGHGGERSTATSLSGVIDIDSRDAITLTGGGNVDASTQIGHGGTDTNATIDGAIQVTSSAGQVATFAGVNQVGTYTQIGHGGTRSEGIFSGAITVDGETGVDFKTGVGTGSYTQIGHGGLLSTSNRTGAISVTSNNGGISFAGSGAAQAYAQLGHGGDRAVGTSSDNITVNAKAGNVSFTAGSADRSYAMLGHGGIFNNDTVAMSGIIDVDATGNVSFISGAGIGNWKFAQLGHGGLGVDGNKDGAISVDAGGVIDFTAANSTGNQNYVQLGHGGYQADGDYTGAIRATALGATGAISLTGGAGENASVQWGHGGGDAIGTFSADLVVRATNDITIAAADGIGSYAQIGHGGADDAAGDTEGAKSGNVAVSTVSGSITLSSGADDASYSQIGHGGFQNDGAATGHIHIDSGSNLTLSGGGTATGASSLIGHGGTNTGFLIGNPLAFSTGTREGDIRINVSLGTTLADNASVGFISHLGATGVSATSHLGLITGMLDTSATAGGVTAIIQNMIAAGNVEIGVTNGDLNVGGIGVFYNGANHVDLIASGNVNASASVQNAGSGAVNIASGWDGMTGLLRAINHNNSPPISQLGIDYAQLLASDASFGLNSGIVNVGSLTSSKPVAIGSAGGETNVLGAGVTVLGSGSQAGAFSQVGFNEELYANSRSGTDAVATTGNISVLTKEEGLKVAGGSETGAFGQVGHGGEGTESSGFSGIVTADLTRGTVDGVLEVVGGGDGSYAQLGNGGNNSNGPKSGAIDVDAAAIILTGGTGSGASARIGNGGSRGSGNIDGDVSVIATVGNIEVSGGSGNFAEAAIGSGGIQYAADSITSATSVRSPLDLIVTGGGGVQASAQIGAGGLESTVDSITGDVALTAGNDIKLTGGTQFRAFSQIGNGGATANGDFAGMIDVVSGNDIFLTVSNGPLGAYSMIGHGDDLFSSGSTIASFSGSGNREGEIKVSASSDIVLVDGMIGHVNNASETSDTGATARGGSTQIAVGTADPADPASGSLIADRNSEFGGADELRFYVPERSGNDVQEGALLNGSSFAGAETDPSTEQRDDEFTVNVTGVQNAPLNQHSNGFDSGPAPVNAGRFAFYYNSIELTDSAVPPGEGSGTRGEGSGSGSGSVGSIRTISVGGFLYTLGEILAFFPEDSLQSDGQRKNESLYSGFSPFSMSFEGYDSNEVSGNSVNFFNFANQLDPNLRIDVGYEDVLELQERILEEEEEENSSTE